MWKKSILALLVLITIMFTAGGDVRAEDSKFRQVDSGITHTLGLTSSGQVYATGYNNYGELGFAETNYITSFRRVEIDNVVSIAAGQYYSLALKTDGTVWAWGYNYYGQLGDGTTVNKSTPVQVSGLTGIIAIDCMGQTSMALGSNGKVYTWGFGTTGQLGNGANSNSTVPVTVVDTTGMTGVTNISAGNDFGMALTSTGKVYAWGYNTATYPVLGNGTTGNSNKPLAVTITNVKEISAGYRHALALKTDGTAWSWGYNAQGQLGDNSTTARSTPVQVSGGYIVSHVYAGGNSSAITATNGKSYGFGYQRYGNFGDGDAGIYSKLTPYYLKGFDNPKYMNLSTGAYEPYTFAIKDDGYLYGCGYNAHGELGTGTNNVASTLTKTSLKVWPSNLCLSVGRSGLNSLKVNISGDLMDGDKVTVIKSETSNFSSNTILQNKTAGRNIPIYNIEMGKKLYFRANVEYANVNLLNNGALISYADITIPALTESTVGMTVSVPDAETSGYNLLTTYNFDNFHYAVYQNLTGFKVRNLETGLIATANTGAATYIGCYADKVIYRIGNIYYWLIYNTGVSTSLFTNSYATQYTLQNNGILIHQEANKIDRFDLNTKTLIAGINLTQTPIEVYAVADGIYRLNNVTGTYGEFISANIYYRRNSDGAESSVIAMNSGSNRVTTLGIDYIIHSYIDGDYKYFITIKDGEVKENTSNKTSGLVITSGQFAYNKHIFKKLTGEGASIKELAYISGEDKTENITKVGNYWVLELDWSTDTHTGMSLNILDSGLTSIIDSISSDQYSYLYEANLGIAKTVAIDYKNKLAYMFWRTKFQTMYELFIYDLNGMSITGYGTFPVDIVENLNPAYVLDGVIYDQSGCKVTLNKSFILKDNVIYSNNIVDGTIIADDIADGAINTAKLDWYAVTNGKLAVNAVDSSKIANTAVTTDKIANTAVTTDKIADTAVTNIKLAANSVDSNKILDNSVGSSDLASNAVTTVKVADGSITNTKFDQTLISTFSPVINNVCGTKKEKATKTSSISLVIDCVNAQEWRVRIKDGTWSGYTAVTNSITLSGLSTVKAYTIEVEARNKFGQSATKYIYIFRV